VFAVSSVYRFVFITLLFVFFFFSSRRRHTRSKRDWSSDVCSSDLPGLPRECHRSCIFQFQDSELLQDSPGETVPPKTSDSAGGRSEERRVGKECRARWSRENVKKRKGEWIAQATKERKRA